MTKKIDKELRQKEQIEVSVIRLLENSEKPRCFVDITSNIRAPSDAVERCLDDLEKRKVIGSKMLPYGAWGKKLAPVWFLA